MHGAIFLDDADDEDLVGVRDDHGLRLDQVVHHPGGFRRTGGEGVADIDHHQLNPVVIPDHGLLFRGDAGIAGQVDRLALDSQIF